MTLVERLRAYPQFMWHVGAPGGKGKSGGRWRNMGLPNRLCHEAADEIERLQKIETEAKLRQEKWNDLCRSEVHNSQ